VAKLKLGAIADDRPVKLTVELPAAVHRDLLAYANYRSCCNIIRECIERVKITRNVLGSERELRIEKSMATGLATRPLGEVGGVSRNRLLVDKMIVLHTILGLIMASKWPSPESQSACRF
jgi:hypothetical protein